MQTRALSGQRFSEKNDFQDGNVQAFLWQNDASDEIDRVGTLDNSASFDAN